MKILTMCQGGHVRSVAAKYLLKYKYGHDVIACGWESNSEATRDMLCAWADYIVIMQTEFKQFIPSQYHSKLFAYDVGPDHYGNPFHPALQRSIDSMIKRHGLFACAAAPQKRP
jgi:protein-tyrosine-phosphatase